MNGNESGDKLLAKDERVRSSPLSLSLSKGLTNSCLKGNKSYLFEPEVCTIITKFNKLLQLDDGLVVSW